MHQSADGGWVLIGDYSCLKREAHILRLTCQDLQSENARLKAEVERLTKQNALATPRHLIASQDIKTLREQIEELKLENSQYEEHHKYGQNVITSLREEVERLTKAGDAMAEELVRLESAFNGIESAEAQIWYIAKEGGCP
jgi:chromosome segregation ATPase